MTRQAKRPAAQSEKDLAHIRAEVERIVARVVLTKDDLEKEMRLALSVIPADDYHFWHRIGAAIYDGLGDGGFDLFDEWSRQCPAKYSEYGTRRKWEDLRRMGPISAAGDDLQAPIRAALERIVRDQRQQQGASR